MEIVQHPRYGIGKVRKRRYNGFELLVEFDDNITRWVRVDSIEKIDNEFPEKKLKKHFILKDPVQLTQFEARDMIEAFRVGIVPQLYIDFTFGREIEKEKVANWFENNNDNVLYITGEYGTGKTNFLHYIKQYAFKNNYAVAFAEINAESPFYKPKQLYKSLVNNFLSPTTNDFRDFLQLALKDKTLQNHKYFKYLIDNYNENGDIEEIWDWIKAKTDSHPFYSLPSLYNHQTAANIYCYLLSSLGWIAKVVHNLNGLILIFDEGENIDNTYGYYYRYRKSWNFLNSLQAIAKAKDNRLLYQPSYNIELTYSSMSDAKETPFLYKQPSYLKLVFAFTHIPIEKKSPSQNKEYHDENEVTTVELEELDKNENVIRQIFNTMKVIYEKAYGKKLRRNIVDGAYQVLKKSIVI